MAAYLALGCITVIVLFLIGWPVWIMFVVLIVVGVPETIWTIVRAHRRSHPRRVGPSAEWIE